MDAVESRSGETIKDEQRATAFDRRPRDEPFGQSLGPRLLVAIALSVSWALALGCGRFEEPLIWPGLEPIEERNLAELPDAHGDPFPEVLNTLVIEDREYDRVHARGWVKAPVSDVWEAIRDPDVLVDRRRVAEWSTEHDLDSELPVSFVTELVVHDIITFEFALAWRQAHTEGNEARPVSVLARGDIVRSNLFLSVLRTSLVLRAADEEVTEVQMMRHIRAVAAGGEDAEQYLRDVFESIVARVHGEPLPTWD